MNRQLPLVAGLLLAAVPAASAWPFLVEEMIQQGRDQPPEFIDYVDEQGVYPNSWRFGRRVAIDGKLAAIAAPRYSSTPGGEEIGGIFMYERSGTYWIFRELLEGAVIGPGVKPDYGLGLELRGDKLYVGSPGFYDTSDFSGLIQVFTWNDVSKTWLSTGGAANMPADSRTGTNLAVSDTHLAATGTDDKVIVYELATLGGSYQEIGAPAGVEYFGGFSLQGQRGNTVRMDETRLLVASPRDFISAAKGFGSVSCYTLQGSGLFTLTQTLLAPYDASNQVFALDMHLSGDRLVVSGSDNSSDQTTGAVHVYYWDESSGMWLPDTTLVHSEATPGSIVGEAGVVLSDDQRTIIASGGYDSGGGGFSEARFAWVLAENGNWIEQPVVPVPASGLFSDLAISGNHYVAGYEGGSFASFFGPSTDPTPFVARMRGRLYHEDAEASPYASASVAAFRYAVEGFEVVPTGEGSETRQEERDASTDPIGDYFGEAEEARAEETLGFVRERLGRDFSDPGLCDLYLDIIYDLASVKAIIAQEALTGLDRLRLESPLPGQAVIDSEIAAYEGTPPEFADGSLPLMRAAIGQLLVPLTDPAGTTMNPPLGYTCYVDQVPNRPLRPAEVLNEGVLEPVEDINGVPITGDLLGGYKDAALLLELLGAYGCDAAELARLQFLAGDTARANEILDAARELVLYHGRIVRSLFQDEGTGADAAELEDAILEWSEGLAKLSAAEDHFASGINPLGFSPDFLVILRDRRVDEENIDHTFDVLAKRLSDAVDTTNQLQNALDARQDALDLYDTYYSGISELNGRLSSVNNDAVVRLSEIVGAIPGDPGYDSIPGPNNPVDGGFISGSELWDQHQNIQRARLAIERNNAEIANLEEKVRIEVERNLFEVGQQNAIKDIRISYGDQRADLEEELGQIRAAQAYSKALADSLNPKNWAQVVGNAVNAGVQVYGEVRQGQILAEKERLAASEEAEVIDAENRILNANSAALIETWMLDMKVLVLNSQENAIVLQQETGRLIALLREKKTLERRIEVHDESLLNRYFADPVHRLRYLSQSYFATRRFEELQRVLFLAARALAYKWNEPFDEFMQGTGFSLASIYKARNAIELREVFLAMVAADDTNLSPSSDTDTFSLKQDAFGYVDNGGSYPDPQTGEPVTATEAFQSLLASPQYLRGNVSSDSFVQVVIPFSTVRDPLNTFHGDTFFRGARNTEVGTDGVVRLIDPGTPSDAGLYLDKITELAVSVPGTHTTGAPSTPVGVTYRGTSIMRAADLGRYERIVPGDPFSPFRLDRLIDESIGIPVRASTFEDNAWRSNNFLTATLSAPLTAVTAPDAPIEPPNGNFSATFRERSVAATNWQIALTLKDGLERVKIVDIDDIILHFRHGSVARQGQ